MQCSDDGSDAVLDDLESDEFDLSEDGEDTTVTNVDCEYTPPLAYSDEIAQLTTQYLQNPQENSLNALRSKIAENPRALSNEY